MEKKNLKFNAELSFGAVRLNNIACEIIFPKKQDGKVILQAQLKASDFSLREIPFLFSLKAAFSNQQGDFLKISCDKVYNLGIQTSYFATNQEIAILNAEPVNLKIREFIQGDENKKGQKQFFFWLTQSRQLSPCHSTEFHYNGNVSVQSFNSKTFEIISGLNFNFIDYYFHYNELNRKNTRISESVLAAELLCFTECVLCESIFPEIDMFLKLVSFSERRRIVCYGYKGLLCGEIVDYYRGDISIPEENFEHSFNDFLIDAQFFEEFIVKSLIQVKSCIFKEYLLDAIGKTAYREYSTVESEYLSYYSALENLINGYRDIHNFHYLLNEDNWKKFSKDLQKFIKNHDLFKDDNNADEQKQLKIKEYRCRIYEKIPELNRISFGTAFKLFCESYQIDVSDLWPLGGREVSVSLTMIRNSLIHGGRFEREEYDALLCAKNHLQWILERCILRVLDWDVEKSNVCSQFLKCYDAYNEWQGRVSLLKQN
ncbi:hypothetical protein PN450_19420 [Dolichospermum lemmermannii CS-548]|uniref:hypothetical protein n=1 Tax=Dolichospermum lemmermannii TaxID=54295 RepID=UPI00232F3465|nr:hypothetical protein [Dolichospermum lemmermannii]MDB9438916.1 hypothetical protein [Dolichospermum lemmermannii CS-548]